VLARAETAPDRDALLAWYDRHRRRLPWRAPPGRRADPYAVWLSEVMLQQTTVAAVGPYFSRFLERFPTVGALAAAPLDDVLKLWAGLGYYSRARNLHACAAAVVARHGGRFPAEPAALRDLPGIGAYTAAAVAAIAFDRPVVPMDGNVERVLARWFAIEQPLPAAKPLLQNLADALASADRPGDFAQALMDLGATLCSPKRPACALCPWTAGCRARALGRQESFPVKAGKKERPQRFGTAFVVVRADGAVLLRTRIPSGLLGGMTEVPTSEWGAEPSADAASPLVAAFRPRGMVRHVFTHFALELDVLRADVPMVTPAPPGCRFVAAKELGGEALPTLFRKVLAAGLGDDVKKPRRSRAGGGELGP
jgi:A/G-specific adenine glycosylase